MQNDEVILAVDDQPAILDNIQLALESVGYSVLTASDGLAALDLLHENQVDLILADIAMPGLNGYQLYEKVREVPEWMTIPFIFVTARAMDSDIRYGKELGVDDYLTKPIQPEDLIATVQGKLKRAKQLSQVMEDPAAQNGDSEIISVGNLHIAPNQYRVWISNKKVNLSTTEFKMLECLARKPEVAIPLEEILLSTHQIGADRVEAGSLLRPLARSIRRKLGYQAGEMGCIKTVRGVGYMLVPLNGE
ncbi:MAG: response regulator [Anaerolineales bacterium]|nr:response regulator [Anaerolineales bacterium]